MNPQWSPHASYSPQTPFSESFERSQEENQDKWQRNNHPKPYLATGLIEKRNKHRSRIKREILMAKTRRIREQFQFKGQCPKSNRSCEADANKWEESQPVYRLKEMIDPMRQCTRTNKLPRSVAQISQVRKWQKPTEALKLLTVDNKQQGERMNKDKRHTSVITKWMEQ